MFCHEISGLAYLRIVGDTPVLLLYAHGIAVATALGIMFTALHRRQRLPLHHLLAVASGLFGLWASVDLALWLFNDGLLHTISTLLSVVLTALLPLSFTYLVLVFFEDGAKLRSYHIPLALIAVPLVAYPPIHYILQGAPGGSCTAAQAKLPYLAYFVFVGLVASVYFLVRFIRLHAQEYHVRHAEVRAVATGTLLFFILFHAGLAVATFAQSAGFGPAFSLTQYVLIGIAVAYALVALPLTHKEPLGGMQYIPYGLLFATLVLLGAQYTLDASVLEMLLTTVVFILALTSSYLLIKSIRREVLQRVKGEQLARYLANANARLRELDRQKTEFVSVASHQLRSPTAAIVGYASLIDDGSYGAVPDNLKEPLSRILQSGKRIALMVDDFLNVSRIEQGRLNYSTDRYDLRDLVTHVFHELQIIGEKKGLVCTLDVGEGGPVWVMGDEGKLKQVFSNILDNAMKYTMAGSVKVSVRVLPNHHSATVTFEDTGIGIEEHAQERLFTKFNRAANANQATVYGTGLGLYVAREIVRAHNGWIHVSSPGLNKGTTFIVELPLAENSVTS